MPETARTRILDATQIERKLQRIARQIIEQFWDADDVILIGIVGRGEEVARRLADILRDISPAEFRLGTIILHKDLPLEHDIRFEGIDPSTLNGQPVVLVDDVLNSGRTLIHATKAILDLAPSHLSTAVLVDRFHRSFPIRADFCGLTLSTNIKEHIEVVLGPAEDAAYLS